MRLIVAILLALSLGIPAISMAQSSPTEFPAATADQQARFLAWRDGFRARALSNGVPAALFDAAFRGRGYNTEVDWRDSNQAEFRRAIWDYLDRAVSDARISNGRRLARRNARTLRAIEARFPVDSHVIMSIWGMESNYGAVRGDIPVIEALGTLATQGRRRAWAERELMNVFRILGNGDIAPRNLTGSWAGAMGHTQFMPSSYLAYARDLRGDGRRDVWGDNPEDALASAANYLAEHGFQRGAPIAHEVRLPSGFDFTLVDGETRHDANFWASRGVRRAEGALYTGAPFALWAPAGGRGPVFAIYPNFRVIKRYNNADSYALAVGLLADRINGGGPLQVAWPRDERPLTVAEIAEVQTILARLGYAPGDADGQMGPNTRTAIRGYQTAKGMLNDGAPTVALLALLRQDAG
ncbi:MAG: lytic murein transglycosylase [Paracoccaceae bacterium]